MRYNIVINQLQCVKHNLNEKQGALMDLIGQLNTWADDEKINFGLRCKEAGVILQTV